MDSASTNPPFHKAFKTLMEKTQREREGFDETELVEIEECELPVIDLSPLFEESDDEVAREECKSEIARASKEWGFFHVVKHGISSEVLNGLRIEQEKVFKLPFDVKKNNNDFKFFAGSYRWGSPTATNIKQFSWSEAFHIPLADIMGSTTSTTTGPNNTLTYRIEQFAWDAYNLAQTLADILAEKIGEEKSKFFRENCLPTTCYLRMNRYPPFPMASPSQVHGLIPHTDSSFLTILLLQDQVRGLQLIKDGKWIAVKPNPHALTINIGDLFQIDDAEKLLEIVKQAAKEGALLVYTLADPSMASSANQACNLWGVPSTDVLGPITDAISSHLGVSPSGLPRGASGRSFPLSDDYFRRIEAVEFTIKQDDGASPGNLDKADIVLTGVSRTGKTPLSIYLAQKGYKVANVPIVMGVQIPRTLFQVDQKKVFGLTINPVVLQSIRKARAKTMGLTPESRTNYFDMDYVRGELEFAGKLFAQNPSWPVIDVTEKAIEETAAVVLRLFHDRKHKCTMPRISKRY